MSPYPVGAPSVGLIRCPHCAAPTCASMPLNACLWQFECPSCRHMLRPKPGDCCVFCSYGDHECQPKAAERHL